VLTWVLMVAIEPARLGSVSIRKGEWGWRGSFNVDSPCPHPSLEGRGNVVFVENVVLAAIEGWRKGIYSKKRHIQFKKKIKSKLLLTFFMFPRP
jgi:hypothetical protein